MDVIPTYRATVLRLVVPAGLIAGIGACLIGALIVLAAWGQDRVAHDDSIRHVKAELDGRMEGLATNAMDYSYWDQAVDNLVTNFDPLWADNNVGAYLSGSRGVESSYVIGPDGTVRYSFSARTQPITDPAKRFSGGFQDLINRARQTASDAHPVAASGFVRDEDHLYLASVSMLTVPKDGKDQAKDRGTGWVLALAIPLDTEVLAQMESHVWFSHLNADFGEPPKDLPSLPIVLADGTVGGHLFWQHPVPGTEMLKWLLPAFAVVLAVLGGLAILFVRHAIRTARSLEAQTAAVVDEKWRAETYLDIVGTVVIALDENARITRINRKGRELLGYSANELLGANWLETVIPVECRGAVGKCLLGLLAEDAEEFQIAENEVVTRSGERKLISWTNTVLRSTDGTIIGTLSSGEDITERRRAEDALLDFQARFQAILDHSPSAIFIKDLDGRFIFVNEAFSRRATLTTAEVIGKTDFHFLDPDTAGKLQAIARDIATTHQPHQMQITVPTGNGPRTVVTVHFPVLDGKGELIGIGGIGTDITEIESARTSAQRLRSELAHVLRVRTAGEMATSFAHELNQPLTAIKNYVTGMNRRLRSGGAKPEEMTRVLEIVGEQAQRAGDIVRGIRKLVQRDGAEFEDCNVNGAIKDVVALIANDAIHLDVKIETVLAEDLPVVPANTVQIQQTILNLARNAMEAMERGQPDRTGRRLTIESARDGDSVIRISVRDTGSGIPEGVGQNIFKPFFSTHGKGMGMGLPICRTIIEVHGGKLWFDSDPEEGTAFHFTLPIHLQPAVQRTEALATAAD